MVPITADEARHNAWHARIFNRCGISYLIIGTFTRLIGLFGVAFIYRMEIGTFALLGGMLQDSFTGKISDTLLDP